MALGRYNFSGILLLLGFLLFAWRCEPPRRNRLPWLPPVTSEESAGAETEAEEEDAPPNTAENSYAIDNMVLFIAAVLVLFMQAGFAMVECGFNESKNAAISDALLCWAVYEGPVKTEGNCLVLRQSWIDGPAGENFIVSGRAFQPVVPVKARLMEYQSYLFCLDKQGVCYFSGRQCGSAERSCCPVRVGADHPYLGRLAARE